jgi:hypothetical protein
VSTPVPAESLVAKLRYARESLTQAQVMLHTDRGLLPAALVALDQAAELIEEVENDLDPEGQGA